ncbi:putative Carbonyl reductase [Glarea lozoyensis 74030]|uniref:Putative Carbonyl reductase n=1 Tax=Glarea lozoyensis (strain ATCC 74030 / MF5533) TaxID=1104152 RepID=H0EG47_GLAL7|nr:putative Carbonyl reductase [Glarea lozoyensis 74030]
MALRTVLITGANSGVGYATATLLSSFPTYHVIMTGRSLPKLQAAKQVIEATGTVQSQLSILHLDVTDLSTITAAAKQVEEQHGHLDVLINNAATGIRIPDMQTRLTEAYKTNVIGPALWRRID